MRSGLAVLTIALALPVGGAVPQERPPRAPTDRLRRELLDSLRARRGPWVLGSVIRSGLITAVPMPNGCDPARDHSVPMPDLYDRGRDHSVPMPNPYRSPALPSWALPGAARPRR